MDISVKNPRFIIKDFNLLPDFLHLELVKSIYNLFKKYFYTNFHPKGGGLSKTRLNRLPYFKNEAPEQ